MMCDIIILFTAIFFKAESIVLSHSLHDDFIVTVSFYFAVLCRMC